MLSFDAYLEAQVLYLCMDLGFERSRMSNVSFDTFRIIAFYM